MPVTKSEVQKIQGTLVLDGLQDLDQELPIKIAVARDCRVLETTVLTLKASGRGKSRRLDFALEVESEQPQGLRLVVGPDVPDDRLLSADVEERWIPASAFVDGTASDLRLELAPRRVLAWRFICRRHTVRGRLVCRRLGGPTLFADAPVRGAEVTAFDIDSFWWWYSRIPVGSAITDENGYFEIEFTWCCLRPYWWHVDKWQISPEIFEKIRRVVDRSQFPLPLPLPLPEPSPVPDPRIFDQLLGAADRVSPFASGSTRLDASVENLDRLGSELVARLPDAPDLRALNIWPWAPWGDCRPDLVFEATQDCGDGIVVVYDEGLSATRWNVPTDLGGIVLVANDQACCGPSGCVDLPDGDCLALQGVGCGGYSIDNIEQDPADPLVGFGLPGYRDRPFGGSILLRGVFGTAPSRLHGADQPQVLRMSTEP